MTSYKPDVEEAHTMDLGGIKVKVFPRRNWAVLYRTKNGTLSSFGMSGDDLAAACTLLRSAGDWLADFKEPAP